MQKIVVVFSLCVLLLHLCMHAASAAEVPFLSSRVNDTARMLSWETIGHLETQLKEHEDYTSNQVVVLTISSLDGETLEEYSMKVVETWKLGVRGRDNGVLLLVSQDDRKVRIEVGYGLEGTLTDIICGSIIRHEIVPRFKEGDFDGGVQAGINAVLMAIKGEYTAMEHNTHGRHDAWYLFWVIIIFQLFFAFWAGFSVPPKWHYGFIFAVPPFITTIAYYGLVQTAVSIVMFGIAYYAATAFFTHSKLGKRMVVRQILRNKYDPYLAGHVADGGNLISGGDSDFSGGGGDFGGGGASGDW